MQQRRFLPRIWLSLSCPYVSALGTQMCSQCPALSAVPYYLQHIALRRLITPYVLFLFTDIINLHRNKTSIPDSASSLFTFAFRSAFYSLLFNPKIAFVPPICLSRAFDTTIASLNLGLDCTTSSSSVHPPHN